MVAAMRMFAKRRLARTPAKAGFTLVEVLVALFVMATAGTALVALRAQTIQATARLETHALAQMLADNLAGEVWLRRDGVADSEAGSQIFVRREWEWQITYEATPQPRLRRVTITVRSANSPRIVARRELIKPLR
jgi:general secretion pathway protein I